MLRTQVTKKKHLAKAATFQKYKAMNQNLNSEPGYVIVEVQGAQLKLASLKGPSGSFEVALAKGGPEDYKYFYRDSDFQVFFTGNADYKRGRARVGTVRRLVDGPKNPKWEPSDSAVFKQNIELFFKTRSCISPWKLLPSPSTIKEVVFAENCGL